MDPHSRTSTDLDPITNEKLHTDLWERLIKRIEMKINE